MFMVKIYKNICLEILQIEKILENKLMMVEDKIILENKLKQLLGRLDFLIK